MRKLPEAGPFKLSPLKGKPSDILPYHASALYRRLFNTDRTTTIKRYIDTNYYIRFVIESSRYNIIYQIERQNRRVEITNKSIGKVSNFYGSCYSMEYDILRTIGSYKPLDVPRPYRYDYNHLKGRLRKRLHFRIMEVHKHRNEPFNSRNY